jgi:hypothetical protein
MKCRNKKVRAEALEILECFQYALELTGDLRADTVSDLENSLAATKRLVRAEKGSRVGGKDRKRRSS